MRKQPWMQFFAPSDPPGGPPGTTPPATDPNKQTEDPSKDKESGDPKFSQSDLDRAVAKALQTREENLRKEFEAKTKAEREDAERKRLENEKNYQTLYEKEAAERKALALASATTKALAEKGLVALEPVFASDLGTIEGRTAAADAIKKVIDAEVERQVNERLKTTPPPAGKPGMAGTPSADEIGRMTMEEYAAARAAGRIR